MADKETKEETSAEGKKSKNLLMIIIIVILLLIVIGGGVIAYLLLNDDEKEAQAAAQQQSAPPPQEKSVTTKSKSSSDDLVSRKLSEIGTLYPLDTFTINLKSDAGRRYLKATISLELNGPELSVELDAKKAVLRDRIIRILTSKTLEEISSIKGKQKVSDQIVDVLNSMLADGSVKSIYFTEFVIQ